MEQSEIKINVNNVIDSYSMELDKLFRENVVLKEEKKYLINYIDQLKKENGDGNNEI